MWHPLGELKKSACSDLWTAVMTNWSCSSFKWKNGFSCCLNILSSTRQVSL